MNNKIKSLLEQIIKIEVKKQLKEQFNMSWAKSTYDVSKFKMNSRRLQDMTSAIEGVREELGPEDVEQTEFVLDCLKSGQMKAAIRTFQHMDTVVREMMPQWLAELAGYKMNPSYYRFEDSLEGTEE